ncbi:MAG TPA: N-ethylammeline chlorohydrolase [Clostridiales bacterium UBA8960]|jgi:5-methylthioadenosine/S-adenosylhomocysteine deaminase|nr:N-ethylammeline chlorohydrolase [Clostridiales bacterium UBA8960]
MRVLIKNVKILTMASQSQTVFSGDIGIEDQRILFVESENSHASKSFVADKTIDGTNHLAMPGLINAHTHMGMSLLRNYADDLPLMTWLNEKIWPVEANLTDEDIYFGTMLSIAELIRSGCTTFRDMYFKEEEVAKATTKSGLRANLGLGLVGVTDPENQLFDKVKALHASLHNSANGRIRIEVAPHSPYTCSGAYLKTASELAQELDTPLHIHLSESLVEVEESIKQLGKTPIQHVRDLGVFNARTSGAHCVHLMEQDFEILKTNQVSVLYNPSSNLKLGNGFANIGRMLKEGINVAIGTDGSSSNNNQNLFEEMHLGALVNKGIEADPTALPAYKMLEIATIGGAKALGIEQEVGTLEPGKKADLILIDLNKPHLTPHHDYVAMLVYSAAGSDVSHMICDGAVIMENYQIKTFDESAIIEKASVLAKQLIERSMSKNREA